MFNDKKANNPFANMFIVVITLIVFFALWPAVKVMLDLAISVNAGESAALDFLMGSVGFIIIFGLIKWIFNSVAGQEQQYEQ